MHPRIANMVKVGVLSADSDETGTVARFQVQYNDNETHGGVPHLQSYGLVSASVPVPVQGARAVTLALGADNYNKLCLGIIDPNARPINLKAGETQLHDNSGQSVYLAQGGTVFIAAGKEVRIVIGGTVVFDLTSTGCKINVPLMVTGSITAIGDLKGNGISLDTHVHTGVAAGSGKTGMPST